MAEDFDGFLQRREAAARAYTTGDPAPLLAMTAAEGQVTFLDPGGNALQGAQPVRISFAEGSAMFGPSTTTRFEVLDSGASGDLAWWTGFQLAEAELKGQPGHVPMRLRITEVFRRSGGAWLLVHRHASQASESR
ncbi:polynucleotide phosphorylase/polyadenylase [Rubellimicrobium mesophilum DSM 19309]|uniref:Polynucleotide phosphorylase/polyadenylase n=1 Tax=Rubellimicrobium mesophilum DSM 19309 TaxID=442562 RepID=A0A017HRK5_9RHOB|nr:nuclear transport factor 2 family protein [Rubellimicrobium mesophilum]EYD76996.1 polynucleotide phosphorylase/polyadenylase [Rubellimicrobium mesophilum DSM 19309]